MQTFGPRFVHPREIKKWIIQSLQLIARRPLEYVALTLALVILIIVVCNLPHHMMMLMMTVMSQAFMGIATLLAMLADNRPIRFDARFVEVTGKAFLVHLPVVFVIMLFEVAVILPSGTQAMANYFQTMLNDASFKVETDMFVSMYNLWYLMGMIFMWPLLLDQGLSVREALRLNNRGKMINLMLSVFVILAASFAQFVPYVGIVVALIFPPFSYVAYRDIFLGVGENATVKASISNLAPV